MHTSRLTSTFFCGEPPRPGGQAGRHDRRQQLRGDADRDGEREQHRVDDRAAQRDVDHEDRDAEHPADLGQQPREAGQAELELGLGVAFAEPDRDPPELRRRARWRPPRRRRLPSCTTVPMNRHDDSSASGAPLATGSGDFSAGTDSPVRIDSSHSRLLAVRSRTSAGTIDPTPRCTMSPGTRWVTSTLTGSPSRVDGDLVADLGVHRLRSAFGPVLVDEPETDRRRDDHPDDDRVEALAHDRRHGRRGEQEPQQRAVQLAGEHRPRARMMGAHRVRPERLASVPTPPAESSPDASRPERIEDLVGRHGRELASIGGSDAAASTNNGGRVTTKYGAVAEPPDEIRLGDAPNHRLRQDFGGPVLRNPDANGAEGSDRRFDHQIGILRTRRLSDRIRGNRPFVERFGRHRASEPDRHGRAGAR